MLKNPSFGGCYIYDIFIIWQLGEEKLKEFLKILNSYPTANFTTEYSLDIEVNTFLGVEVIRCGNKLLTDLHIKHTDTYQCLEFSSSHMYHSKISIPFRLSVLIGFFQ